jgi:hypothetical protein
MDSGTNNGLVNLLNNPANSTLGQLPLSFFNTGQFLCLSPECQGGLILQKPFYADFVGPGALVGSSIDVNCTSVYVIGTVEFDVPTTNAERQRAFQKRMAYSQRLQDISGVEAPLRRSFFILKQLSHWVGTQETHKIPDELVARLAGLLTRTVKLARKKYPTETCHKPSQKTATQEFNVQHSK